MRTLIPPGICPKPYSSLYAIMVNGDARMDAEDYWKKYCEEEPFDSSREDNKPRVVNLSGDKHNPYCNMLCAQNRRLGPA